MKLAIILLVAGIAASPAFGQARYSGKSKGGPLHFIAATGHEVKETAKDFILWKHPAWNLMAFAEIAADIADAKTTADCQHMPNCNEANTFLYGRHPDFHKVLLIDLGTHGR